MKRLRAVHVAWWLLLAIALFVVLYNILPFQTFLGISLNMAFAAALAAVVRYAFDAIRAAKEGMGGVNFMLTAMFSIFCTTLFQRGYAMSLDALGRPDWLVMSFVTILVPWLMAASLSLAVVAPDIDGKGDNSSLKLGISLGIFVIGMAAGVAFYAMLPERIKDSSILNVWPQLVNRATCKPEEKVWVSSTGTYHLEDSPYRSQVIPRYCFKTAADAEIRGFRAVKARKRDAKGD